ncbi:MAG: hypothetical protein QOJ73_1370 [Streptosporangiaceae bacterium]|jgi:hypothetical protein|nr:hypothetical protein [Streptosporangiaceae bacterium]
MSDSNDAGHGGGHARWARAGAQRHDAAYAEAMDDELDIACAVLSAGVTSDDLASAR